MNQTFRLHNLVLTVSYFPSEGYEVLVEVDTDEAATGVNVNVSNAVGDEVEWEL